MTRVRIRVIALVLTGVFARMHSLARIGWAG